jgi:hypothetical protein
MSPRFHAALPWPVRKTPRQALVKTPRLPWAQPHTYTFAAARMTSWI